MHRVQLTSTDSNRPLRATAVVVLYRMSPKESPALESLMDARAELPAKAGEVSILVWDNSPEAHSPGSLDDGIEYLHDPRNLGLANAYNRALERAIRDGSDWLITLDQDTRVPRNYLVRFAAAALRCLNRPDVAAIVPYIVAGKKRLSPYRFALGAFPQWYPPGFCGIPKQPVFAFNSGAMLSVAALRQTGGYDPYFPLDHSDTAVFHNLHRHGKRVYIVGDLELHHDFSMLDIRHRMSVERYRRSLQAETTFWDLHMSRLARLERTLRLGVRMTRQWRANEDHEVRQITRQSLRSRLFQSRAARLSQWRDSVDGDVPNVTRLHGSPGKRPKVSVSMAAYNGGRFIEAQLRSILVQLAPNDEVVIVDDASRDDTPARVSGLADRRVRLYAHERNRGVVATFEDALRAATGDVIFLSDDDDLWAPDKVDRILHAFQTNPDAQVVVTRAALIDERDAPLPDSRWNRDGRFMPGFWRNVFRNHYQGAAMAIRAALLGQVLPFPRGKSFLHDAWVGTCNEADGGKTVFLDEPLLLYRRHAHNASRSHSLWKIVRIRFELLLSHLARVFRGQSGNTGSVTAHPRPATAPNPLDESLRSHP